MKLKTRFLATLAALPALAFALASCSAVGVLNGITPSSSFDRDKNVSYGDLDRQRMDIYRAATPRPDAPVMVFVHGGSWSEGDKNIYKFLAEGFTKEGYHVVVPNYRLYPEGRYPDMVVDTGLAARAAAELFSGQPVVLVGHSAGGYNVLMAAMAPDVSGLKTCSTVAGVISLAAPTGAYPMKDAPFTTIFPGRLEGDDAPLNRVDGPLPPMMLVNGLDDTTVGPKNAEALAAKLEAAGLRVESKLYEGMNHTDAVRVLSRHFDGGSPLKGDMLSFLAGLPTGPDYCAR